MENYPTSEIIETDPQLQEIHDAAELISKSRTKIVIVEPQTKELAFSDIAFNRAQLTGILAFLMSPKSQWGNIASIQLISDNKEAFCNLFAEKCIELSTNIKYCPIYRGNCVEKVRFLREGLPLICIEFFDKNANSQVKQNYDDVLIMGIKDDPQLFEIAFPYLQTNEPTTDDNQCTTGPAFLELQSFLAEDNIEHKSNAWSFPNPNFPIFNQRLLDSHHNPYSASAPLE